jgi:hypothetical protein
MKVLFIEPCYVGFGGYFRAENICRALGKKGINVTLLVSSNEKLNLRITRKELEENVVQYELPRIDLHFFFNGRILRGLIGLLFGIFNRYDIIHVCVPVQIESMLPGVILKLLKKKIVLDWDDYWEGSTIYGEIKILKRYVSFCELNAPKFFQNVIVVSEFLKNLAYIRGATNILKLINYVNIDQLKVENGYINRSDISKLNDKYIYVIAFGNTYINDRAFLLFKLFSIINSKNENIKLLFNQDAEKIYKEQKLIKRLNPDFLKSVINIGNINKNDIKICLDKAKVTLFAMGDEDNERACYPIRVGTYISGESIIAINDNQSEVVNTLRIFDCALIEKDLNKLADLVIKVIDNEDQFDAYKKKVNNARLSLNWDLHINELIDFYRKVL